MLTAQTDLYSAQQSLITASLSRFTNLVDLYQYLGGGWIGHSGGQERAPDAPSIARLLLRRRREREARRLIGRSKGR